LEPFISSGHSYNPTGNYSKYDADGIKHSHKRKHLAFNQAGQWGGSIIDKLLARVGHVLVSINDFSQINFIKECIVNPKYNDDVEYARYQRIEYNLDQR